MKDGRYIIRSADDIPVYRLRGGWTQIAARAYQFTHDELGRELAWLAAHLPVVVLVVDEVAHK